MESIGSPDAYGIIAKVMAAVGRDAPQVPHPTTPYGIIAQTIAAVGFEASLNLASKSFPASQWPSLSKSQVDALAQSLRDTADETVLAEADALYTQVIGPAQSSPSSGGLVLMIPFEPDPYLRATLQLVSVLSILTVLFVAGTYAATIPMLSGILYAAGTPSIPSAWKATGTAYDRLYGTGKYMPPRQLPAQPRQKRRSKGNDVW